MIIWWHSSSRLRFNAPMTQASRAPGAFAQADAATQLSARPGGLGVAAPLALRVLEGKGFASNFIPQTPALYTPPAQGGPQLRPPARPQGSPAAPAGTTESLPVPGRGTNTERREKKTPASSGRAGNAASRLGRRGSAASQRPSGSPLPPMPR